MMQVESMLGSVSSSLRKGFPISPFSNNNPNCKSEGAPLEVNGHHNSSSANCSHVSSGSGSSKTIHCHVVFLDDSSHTFEIDKKAKGSSLLDLVFNHLDLHEKEYFGLMFNDAGGQMPAGHSPDVMRWLDPGKLVRKQIRNRYVSGGNIFSTLDRKDEKVLYSGTGSFITFYFRVKFYVTDPSRLHEEMTRYHVYLQVKKDISEGRLSAPFSTLCLLTSYVAQAVLGDYEYESCRPGYLSPFRDLRKHCNVNGSSANLASNVSVSNLSQEDIERRISELHKLHKGQPPSEAEINFLEHAKRLEMYGISLHNGKDSHGRDIQLGVTCIGLVVFQNQVRINTFSWSKIVKISFKRKQFFIQLRKEVSESYDTLLGFNLASYRSCKNLWKSAVEHHSFFRLHSPKVAPRRFLMTLGSKFRYSGRTEFQTHGVQTGGGPQKGPPGGGRFPRSTSSRKTLPLNLESKQVAVAAGKAPKLASPETSSIGSSIHSHAGGGLKPKPSAPPPIQLGHKAPPTRGQQELNGSSWSHSSTTLTGERSTPQSIAHRAMESFNNKVQSLSTKLPKKAWQEDITSDDEGGFLDPNRRISSLGRLTKASSTSPQTTSHNKPMSITPTSLSLSKPSVRLAFADESSLSDQATNSVVSGFSTGSSRKTPGPGVLSIPIPSQTVARPSQPPPPSLTLTSTTSPPSIPPLTLTSSATLLPSSDSPKTVLKERSKSTNIARKPPKLDIPKETACQDQVSEETNGGLVFITIIPDEQGRFGFDVKGGVDQKLPIIVSRVGSNTPADKCYPKLNEGDQVVLINGRDVSSHTHDQVVNFIRASSEPHSGQLILAVRQSVYLGEDVDEEPEFAYVPESPSPCMQEGQQRGALLAQSMLLLEESLTSGAIVGQFEQLYRRNPSLAMSICHTQENVAKNRYRDISPYDSTRVILNECPTGDYINANHVVMTIPGSGIVNRYIATQGPLASTCTDFWYMCWECQSSLVIMLTTIVERGRVKCHQYWPDLGLTIEFGKLKVTCVKDDCSANSFAFRDFEVEDQDTKEVRHITQMAYLSWPDHGVPDNDDEFVDFVEKVRARRQGYSLCPTVVHCSAGIGRTGVVILMESALYLIEANQPVYPLELTRIMRDQRASMIQTPAQYRFVCQAILRVYQVGQVKPLPEFSGNGASGTGSSSSSTTGSTGKSRTSLASVAIAAPAIVDAEPVDQIKEVTYGTTASTEVEDSPPPSTHSSS